MKKLYATLLAVIITATSFGQYGEIENGNFENWTNQFLYEAPTTWLSQPSEDWNGVAAVLKSTDASLGTYSCEITSKEVGAAPDTTFGFILHGVMGNMGPQDGIAYTDVFDEITFDYKSDLPVGDTLYSLIMRFDGSGSMIEQFLKPAAYGTHSTWSNGSISVPSTPQSKLVIGFVVGNPFGSGPMPTPDVWARIDNVILKNGGTATTNIPNYSFENWTTESTEEADNWYTINNQLAAQGLDNALKTTDANTGTYAMELSTIYSAKWDDTLGGMLSIGAIDLYNFDPFSKTPYSASPNNFEYAYKYTGANGDMSAQLFFEFYNSGSNIGGGSVTITDQSSYFTGSLAVSLSGTPDSVRVVAYSGDSLGSVLKIDDLAFTGGNVGIDEFSALSMDVYPNPANDYVMVKSENEYDVEILDISGKVVYSAKNNSGVKTINTSEFKKGAYFIRINSLDKTKTQKLIIQ